MKKSYGSIAVPVSTMSDITTIGETMLRLSPQSGERLETATALDFRTAGAESNVAIAAQRLGAESQWISKLPESPLGRRVRNEIRQHGVTPTVCWSSDHRQGTYYIEQGATPRETTVIYDREDAAVTTLTPGEIPIQEIEKTSILYTTGITPALSETLFDTTESLLKTDTTVGFDLNYRSKLWSQSDAQSGYEKLLPHVDLLFAPERDVRSILEIGGSAESIVKKLYETYDCEVVVLTRGENGAIAYAGDEIYTQSAYDTETIDAIGTGDAFVGGYLAKYITNASVDVSLQYAAATAALKRTIQGDLAVITPTEVENVIRSQEQGIKR